MKQLFVIALFFTISTLKSQHVDFIDMNFDRVDSIALAYQFKGRLDPIKISKDLTQDLTSDIDKFRVIFRWISENISYDVLLYRKTVEKDFNPKRWPKHAARWKKRFHRLYVNHTIKESKTICEGYAWLLETMCLNVGVQCEAVEGYARTEDHRIGRAFKVNHAWNAVKINGKWYLSDPTWASGSVDNTLSKFYRHFNPVYFLAEPEALIANHYPVNKTWTLMLTEPTLPEFFNAPIKTTGFIRNRVVHYKPVDGVVKVKKDSVLRFAFTTNREFKSISTEVSIFRNGKLELDNYNFRCEQDRQGFYSIAQIFKSRGSFELRIFINARLSLIYIVNVV